MMPVVRFGFDFPAALAVGTTLTAVVFTAAAGAIKHISIGNVDKNTALWVGIFGVLGVIIGSLVFAYLLPYGALIDLIVGLAFICMLYEGLLIRGPATAEGKVVPGSGGGKGLLGTLIGFLTGIIGLGGGYALVPSFIYFLKSPVKIAIGTSMASFVSMALVGSAFKMYQGVINAPAAIIMGVAAALGAIYGAGLVAKIKASTLKTLFGFLFLYVSLKYIFLYFGIHI